MTEIYSALPAVIRSNVFSDAWSATLDNESNPPMEHLDLLIIGAGLSGIGAACHLQAQHPGKHFAIPTREVIAEMIDRW